MSALAWEAAVAPGTIPRLLAGLQPSGPFVGLAEHRADQPAPPRVRRRPEHAITAEIERAGLTGRGGANFPTARKWRSVLAGKGRPIVVVNGAEGEPPAGKDALLMSRVPHMIIDGALLAAAAIGAERVFVCIGVHSIPSVDAMERALAERANERPGVRIELRLVPDRYVAGESRALVNMLNGGEAVPTATPAHSRGVGRRPTLVQNAETLAHVALIMARGAAWYRSAGTPDEPGTRLVSLSGALPLAVVCEIEAGTPLLEVFEANGGDPAHVSGVLVGGYYGTWIEADAAFAARVSVESLAASGADPGCGVLYFHPKHNCGVSTVASIAGWFAQESAGQCGPCVFGLQAIAKALRDVECGIGVDASLQRVQRWTSEIPGRGGCNLPDGAAKMIRSGLRVFGGEVEVHRTGSCSAWLTAGVAG